VLCASLDVAMRVYQVPVGANNPFAQTRMRLHRPACCMLAGTMPRKPKNPINDIKDAAGAWLGGNRGTVQSRFPSDAGNRDAKIDAGGTRGRVPDRQIVNQTTFEKDQWGGRRHPVFPEPQSIQNMPPQIAAWNDASNKRGKIASTQNMSMLWHGDDNADKFLHDIDTVYINPLYKLSYMKSAETADRKEYRAETLSNLDAGLQKFANYNSKYFDKKFKVLPYPKTETSNKFNGQYSNPLKTLQLDIQGSYANHTAIASVVSQPFRRPTKKRGVDKDQSVGPYQHGMWINTSYNSRTKNQKRTMYAPSTADVLQHEFGHNLGINHPDDLYEDANTVMSYKDFSYKAEGKLMPSDINMYQKLYKQRDVKKRAKSAYKGVAKKRK
jgi:hypothetical protein